VAGRHGKVTNNVTGAPAADTAVRVVQNGPSVGTGATDASGNYRTGLSQGAGKYTIQPAQPAQPAQLAQPAQFGDGTATREIDAVAGGAVEVNLEVSPVIVDASMGKRLPSRLAVGERAAPAAASASGRRRIKVSPVNFEVSR
jgi:hypothetical protein